MNAVTTDAADEALAPRHGGVPGPQVVADALTVTWRNLLNLRRNPQVLVFSTIQPVIFVVMFRYVFGGAIQVTGSRYVDYLMPGIFAQTITFGSVNTGVGLAEDLSKGVIDRFRSLPIARSAVLVGRTTADLARNVFVIGLMVVMGFIVGFRLHTNVAGLLAGIALMLLFSFSLSWGFALLGMNMRNAEAAQAAAFPIIAPLTFASTAFVQASSMPGWLQVWARNQPVSVVTDAVRHLVLGGPTTASVLKAVAWSVGIVVVFAPLAVARYRKVT